MNDQQLNQALSIATQNSNELAELVKYANGIGFDCPDARAAAKLSGEYLVAKGANEPTVIQSMGSAYEAVLFTAMNKAGRINAPNQTYANRIQSVYNQLVRLINSTKQEQGRVQGQGTNIFNTNTQSSQSSLFNKPDSGQSSLFNKPESSQSSLFTGGKSEEPLFASKQQEEVSSSIFGGQEETVAEQTESVLAPQPSKGTKPMESLIAHETEVNLRKTCVTARQVSESIALYKDSLIDENAIADFVNEEEGKVNIIDRRTPVQIRVMNNLRNFEIGEGEVTKRTLEAVSEDVIKFHDLVDGLQKTDFSSRMVSNLIRGVTDLYETFNTYAATAREHADLETLTVTDATRAATAVTTELYRAMAIAIDFVSEDKGIQNAEGTGVVHFELDFSNFKEEAEQLEEFYLSYDGKQSSTFELLFCQFARALGWMRLKLTGDNLTVGRREVHVELPYPLFDNVEIGAHHKLLERDVMGENLDLLTDLADVVEKRLSPSRLYVVDGLYRTAYIDRAYNTCRPKAVLQ